jgi:small conductance mechanosensitive channel
MSQTLSQAWYALRENIATFIAALPVIIIGIIVAIVFVWLSSIARRQTIRLMHRAYSNRALSLLIGRLVRGVIIGIGILVGMTIAFPTFQPSELIQILGVGGIAIGFAFQNIFENFLAGVILLIDQPFQIGDQVIAKDHEGTVEDIQLRATYVQTYDGRMVVIPNSDMLISSVTVNTAFEARRSEYDVGISYDDDIERAQAIMLEVMSQVEGVLSEPEPDTIMVEMGSSAIIIRVRWWTASRKASVLTVQNLVLRTMKTRLEAESFTIPFPIRTVILPEGHTST